MSQDNQSTPSFKMRGEHMTRIEAFVAAAFAFAITMLIISIDDIPSNMVEFVLAIKNVPSFVASCAVIVLIWHGHADWSRRYGLEDKPTILLSGALICIVLIFIYPLRLMMQGLFFALSGGYFPLEIEIASSDDLRVMFLFYSIGFLALTINFWAMYQHVLGKKHLLALNQHELDFTKVKRLDWISSMLLTLAVIVVMYLVPGKYLLYTPHLYFLLPIKTYLVRQVYYARQRANLATS